MSYSMISQYVFKLRLEVSDKTPIEQLFILKLKLTELENSESRFDKGPRISIVSRLLDELTTYKRVLTYREDYAKKLQY